MGMFDNFLNTAGNVAKAGYNNFVKPTVNTVSQLPSQIQHTGNAFGIYANAALHGQQGTDLGNSTQRALDEMGKTWFANHNVSLLDKKNYDQNGNFKGVNSGDSLATTAGKMQVGDASRKMAGVAGENALNIASLNPAKEVANIALQGGKIAAGQLVKDATLAGVKAGTKYGAGYGASGSLQKDNLTPGTFAKDTAMGAGTGALVGGVAGGALAGANHGATSMVQSMLDKKAAPLRNMYLVHAMQTAPHDIPATPSKAPTNIPVVRADLAVHQNVPTMQDHAIPKLEAQIANHSNATPNQLPAMQQFAKEAKLSSSDYHTYLTHSLDDLQKGGLNHLATHEPVQRPVAEAPTKNADGSVKPVAEPKQLSPLDHHTAIGQDTIAQNHQLQIENQKVKDRQAQTDKAATQPTADGKYRGGGLKSIPQNAVEAKMAELKLKQQNYKRAEAEKTDARFGATQPSPEELAASNKNAEASMPQATVPLKTVEKPAEKTVPVKTVEKAPMNPKETGSAHENQGDPTPRPTKAGDPKATEPPVLKRTYGKDGKVESVTHTGTGEVVKANHSGSPIDEYNKALMHEDQSAYGKTAQDVLSIHNGNQKSLDFLKKAVDDHLSKNFTKVEQDQISHFREGTLKASEVSNKVKETAKQLDEMDRLHFLLHKEANNKMGEINNGTDNYVQHINLDKNGKSGNGKVGLGKFSTRSSVQKGREIIKFTDQKGNVRIGIAENLKLKPHDGNKFIDSKGNIYHPSQATIQEKNDAGMHYETNAAKIAQSTMDKGAKVANNSKLGRNLTTQDHGKNIIERKPNEKTPPKGYMESHIPGMEGHWMSNAYHDRLRTASDTHHGLLWNTVKAGGKVIGLPARAINNAFFAENSGYHQLINETAQAFTTAGAGAGKGGNIFKEAFRGIPNAIGMAKSIKAGNESAVKHDAVFHDYLRDGGKVSQTATTKSVSGAIARLKQLGHNVNVMGRAGHYAAIHIGDTIRLAKYQELKAGGMSGKEAVKLIDKVQGDYSNLNSFEKEIVTNYVQFYPFFKHQLTSLSHTVVGGVRNPGKYAGAAMTAGLTYATYVALDKGLQAVTGNKYADIKKGGMLGLIDDIKKAPQQIAGYTDKAGNKHPGVIPSIVANRLNPTERIGIEQGTGKSLVTNQKFDTSGKGRLDQAGKSIAEMQQNSDLSSGKKSLAEVALNLNGVKLPHGMNTPAAPNLKGNAIGDLINVSGHDSKKTIDTANLVKDGGGSKLNAYQVLRANGDKSLDKFFSKNPQLDPLSDQFQGFKTTGGGIVKGKDAYKQAGGSSLAYMQALKDSGATTYDKFFAAHPNLDPTSKQFQGFKKSGGSSQLKYQNAQNKFRMQKARQLSKPIGLKTSKGVSAKTAKMTNLKFATLNSPKTKAVSLAGFTPKVSHSAGVKLRFKA